jgi:hypothetical protein
MESGAAGLGHDDVQIAAGTEIGRRLDIDALADVAVERRVDHVRDDEVRARSEGGDDVSRGLRVWLLADRVARIARDIDRTRGCDRDPSRT